jgi:hypothetical protein
MADRRDAWQTIGTGLFSAGLGAGLSAPAAKHVAVIAIPAVVAGLCGLYLLGAMARGWWPVGAATHEPPGGGYPFHPPLPYALKAARQIVSKIAESEPAFDSWAASSVLKQAPRSGTDPVYEPLPWSYLKEGIDEMVRLGELLLLAEETWEVVRSPTRKLAWRRGHVTATPSPGVGTGGMQDRAKGRSDPPVY